MPAADVVSKVKKVRRGTWASNPAYKAVAETQFVPFDIQVMNFYDKLVPGRGPELSFWQMMATPGEAFYLAPERKTSVKVVSPNDYSVELSTEIAGIVATLFALGHQGTREASQAYRKLPRVRTNLSRVSAYCPTHRLSR
jgi:hypothetical protein